MKNILLIIALMITTTTIFAQDVPKLKQQNGKYALVDNNNKVISDWYSAIYDFEYGIAIVRDYTKFGAINRKGQIVIPVQYTVFEIQEKFIEYLEKYVKSNPVDTNILIGQYIKASNKLLISDQEKALEFYNKAISLAPDSAELYVKIGDILNYVDQEKALKFYIEAISLAPDSAELYVKIGDILKYVDQEKALEFYYKAISLAPDSLDLYVKIGDKLFDVDQEKALEFYYKAISLAPDSLDLYVKIGDKLFDTDQEKALEFYNKANQIKPQTVNLKEKFDFIKSGIAAIKNKDGKYGVIDTAGKLLTKQWYDRAWANERNIVIALEKDGKWTMINNKGEFLKGWYYNIYIFSEGLAFVQKEENGKWGVINEKGDLVIDYQFDDVKEIFKDGKAKVVKDGETFWINRKGKRIKGEGE